MAESFCFFNCLLDGERFISAGFYFSYDSIFVYNNKAGRIIQPGLFYGRLLISDRLPSPLRNKSARTYLTPQSLRVSCLFPRALSSRYSYKPRHLQVLYGF